jgi:hypothetical protein
MLLIVKGTRIKVEGNKNLLALDEQISINTVRQSEEGK